MAYDEGLAQRIREYVGSEPDVSDRLSERKMFGGLAFMLGGHMYAGVVGEELMVRVGPEQYDACLAEPHARAMDFTGRPMKGLLYVACEGFESDTDLASWIDRGTHFAASLPPKTPKP